MRIILSLFGFLLFFNGSLFAQWQDLEFEHGNRTREYKLYVPQNFEADETGNLILALHGLNSPLETWVNTSGFKVIADTTNTVVVAPQAVSDFLVGTAWNSGAGIDGIYFPNQNVDDVGFLTDLVDSVMETYAIDPERIFVTGFSMGGFMTQRLALESNEKFVAFASVAGTIGAQLPPLEFVGKNLPIMHIHGTDDSVVNADANLWGLNAQETIDFWVENNMADPEPEIVELTYENDYSASHYTYRNEVDDYTVEYLKVYDLEHIWLGYNSNITYAVVIWDFFMRSVNGYDDNMEVESFEGPALSLYPNPVVDNLNITWSSYPNQAYKIQLFDTQGRLVYSKESFDPEQQQSLDLSYLSAGIYYLNLQTEQKVIYRKIIKN